MASERLLSEAAQHLQELRRLREYLDGPQGDNPISLFLDGEDYPAFDKDPGVNFTQGFLTGAAEAVGMKLEDFLALVEK